MSRPLRIDFALAGGSRQGLGHVMRCAALACEARRRGHVVRAWLAGGAEAHDPWMGASDSTPHADWSEWRAVDAPDVLVIDHPDDKGPWLDRAEAAGVPASVIDDASAIGRAPLTIGPALHEAPVDRPDRIAGPRFAVLSTAHRWLAPGSAGPKTRFLLSLGGADPHRVTLALAPVLERVLDGTAARHLFCSRDVVLGAAFPDPEGAVATTLSEAGWQVHRALTPARMATLMAQSRLAVMGFGTSLTELAWHRTPQLSVAHHEADVDAALRLEQLGIGRVLGHAGALDLERVAERVRESIEDRSWRERSAERAFRAIEGGRGVERIVDRLEALAESTAAGPQPGREAERRFLSRTRNAACSMSSPSRP